jgi:hypothetical protein
MSFSTRSSTRWSASKLFAAVSVPNVPQQARPKVMSRVILFWLLVVSLRGLLGAKFESDPGDLELLSWRAVVGPFDVSRNRSLFFVQHGRSESVQVSDLPPKQSKPLRGTRHVLNFRSDARQSWRGAPLAKPDYHQPSPRKSSCRVRRKHLQRCNRPARSRDSNGVHERVAICCLGRAQRSCTTKLW